MNQQILLLLTVAGVGIGIAGLFFLWGARTKMGVKIRTAAGYASIGILFFILQGVGTLWISQSQVGVHGLWVASTFLLGMLFLGMGCKTLAASFR